MPCHSTLCFAVIVNAMLCYVTWPVILCRVNMIFHKPNWNIFIVTVNGYPRTCYEVKIAGGLNGYHTLDPEQDGFEPIGVFCNISSTPVAAVVHHNLEEWLHITGYEGRGSYEGQVGTVANVRHDNPDPESKVWTAYCFTFRMVERLIIQWIMWNSVRLMAKLLLIFEG